VNRLISTNIDDVRPDRLPPPRREGPARVLFIHGNILGQRTVTTQLERYCAEMDDIDAVHIELSAPLLVKVLGKSLPIPAGWDLHGYRYLKLWRRVHRSWFRSALPPDRFDVLHATTQTHALASMEAGPRLAVNIDSTACLEVSELGFSRAARAPYLAAERRILAAADLIACRNAWSARSVERDYGVPASRIMLVRNSVELPPPREVPARGDLVEVAFVGNDWKRKGGDLVLAAHQARFADTVHLHVIGERAAVDHSARNVTWHGSVPRERLFDGLLPAMDLFVLASRYDMLPWSALEAAAVGLPIVAPRLGGFPEIVVDGESGVLYDPADPDGLGDAWASLLDDEPRRREMGAAARARVETHFNADRTYPALLQRLVAIADGASECSPIAWSSVPRSARRRASAICSAATRTSSWPSPRSRSSSPTRKCGRRAGRGTSRSSRAAPIVSAAAKAARRTP
jgi:glycosyltransferase involved in cell wall biosynthesis